jgi:hypothetical protein
MSNQIKWLPNTEADIASYNLETAPDAVTLTFTALATVTHDLNGPEYDGTHFFYNDVAGINSAWYRIIAVDTGGNLSAPSPAFQPAAAPSAPLPQTVGFNQDYGSVSALMPVDTNGSPIDQCQVRVFYTTDYNNNDLSTPVGTTTTNGLGEWEETIFVSPGFTYTIHFELPSVFSPNSEERTV